MAPKRNAVEASGALLEAPFRDRIKGFRRVKASELVPNAKNWRIHPEGQKSALSAMLQEVGFVSAVIAREVDGKLELVDGHMRAKEAGDAEIPVLIVDLNDEEAAKVLVTFDPITNMALVDDAALGALIGEVDLEHSAELRRLLTDLGADLEQEEEAEAEERAEVPGMALQPHEHYDYLVVLATTAQEWNVLCGRLGLVPEKRRGRMGTCRAVRATKLLEAMGPRADGK